jgi:hypothetical protein
LRPWPGAVRRPERRSCGRPARPPRPPACPWSRSSAMPPRSAARSPAWCRPRSAPTPQATPTPRSAPTPQAGSGPPSTRPLALRSGPLLARRPRSGTRQSRRPAEVDWRRVELQRPPAPCRRPASAVRTAPPRRVAAPRLGPRTCSARPAPTLRGRAGGGHVPHRSRRAGNRHRYRASPSTPAPATPACQSGYRWRSYPAIVPVRLGNGASSLRKSHTNLIRRRSAACSPGSIVGCDGRPSKSRHSRPNASVICEHRVLRSVA